MTSPEVTQSPWAPATSTWASKSMVGKSWKFSGMSLGKKSDIGKRYGSYVSVVYEYMYIYIYIFDLIRILIDIDCRSSLTDAFMLDYIACDILCAIIDI